MNLVDPHSRWDELSAGRALGNLDHDEIRELQALGKNHELIRDDDWDLLAASLEVQAALRSTRPLPAHLSKRLHGWSDQLTQNPPETIVKPRVSSWQRLASSPATGWIAAAAALVFAFIVPNQPVVDAPETAASRLRATATDVVERNFSGVGAYEQTKGSVIWSDANQRGYMILSNLPANNPSTEQYQLWIVDPARDADSPVDGGVFDIPAGGSSVVVPIDAKLAINKPQAFVITLEQPGGVVKSKQKNVVAVAKG